MENNKLVGIYFSNDESNWPVVQTDKHYYELRCGVVGIIDSLDKNYEEVKLEGFDILERQIKAFWTDSIYITIEMENEVVLDISANSITGDGIMYTTVRLVDREDFLESLANKELFKAEIR